MIYFTKVDDLNKVLRSMLITQSELNKDRVANALSTYGETLDKALSSTISDSYDTKDSVLIFELKTRPSNSNVSYKNEVDRIIYYMSYELKLTLYGSDLDLPNKIVARFRSASVRDALQQQGVYIESVSDPYSFNEFINDVIWPRNDISINLTAMFEIKQIKPEHEFEVMTGLNIIKEGD